MRTGLLLFWGVLLTGEAFAQDARLFVTNNLTNNSPGGRLLEFNGLTGQFKNLIANVDTPRGIKVGPDGNVYVASANGNSVLKFSISDTGIQQTTFVPPGLGGLFGPEGLTFGPDGNLYVTADAPARVLRFNGATGSFMNVFATDPQMGAGLQDVRFGPNGNLYVASLDAGVFQFNGQNGASLGRFVPPTNFALIGSITFGPDNNLYVATGPADSVLRYNGTTGAFLGTFVAAGSGGLDDAEGIEFGPDGKLYVAGAFNDAILRYDGQTGAFNGIFASTPIDAPQFFAFVVPEPSTLILATLGTISLVLARRRRHS